MTDIIISEFMDRPAVDGLSADFDVLYDPELVDRPQRLGELIAEVPALIVRNRTQVDAALVAKARRLRVVGRLGVGLDNLDLEACEARGIAVCPATGANAVAVAEYVIFAILALLRGAHLGNARVLRGDWPKTAMIGREADGKRLGLVGFGTIARLTAERARALGMEIAAHDPFVPAEDPAWRQAARLELDDLLASSDVVSLHVPLAAATRHLIDARRLAAMKADAVLINTARGGVVDEAALVAALREGRLAGCALDVFETEPLTAEAGRIFAGLANVILTPHIGGVTEESNRRVSALIAASVRRVLKSA